MKMCGKNGKRDWGKKNGSIRFDFDSNAKRKYERDAEIRATADRCCMNKKREGEEELDEDR